MANPIDETDPHVLPEILEPDEVIESFHTSKESIRYRRKVTAKLMAIGETQKQVAERVMQTPVLLELYPTKTFESVYNIVKQDALKIVKGFKLEDTDRSDYARWQYHQRQEMVFKKAWKDSNNENNSEFFRVQSLKVAMEASKNSAKVSGVDVERPMKILLSEEWEVYIDDYGNAQRRKAELPAATTEVIPPDDDDDEDTN